MSFSRRQFLLVGVLLLGAGLVMGSVLGALWYRLELFPYQQLREWTNPPEERVPLSKKMIITRYTAQTPVFSDRQYFDTIGDERLEGLYLLQVPRHYAEQIMIEAHSPVTVYRFVSDDNVNTAFESWTDTDIPISVRGNTTTHTRVVKKDFPAGTFALEPGGPIAASPVLIELGDTAPAPDIEVLDQAEFIYTK